MSPSAGPRLRKSARANVSLNYVVSWRARRKGGARDGFSVDRIAEVDPVVRPAATCGLRGGFLARLGDRSRCGPAELAEGLQSFVRGEFA